MTVEISVDEATLVARRMQPCSVSRWPEIAEKIVGSLADALRLPELLEPPVDARSCPAGYTHGYQYGDDAYMCIAYHYAEPEMGVIVKMSATAFALWRQCSVKHIDGFIRMAAEGAEAVGCNVRLSRLDVTADYIDEGDWTVTDIYSALVNKSAAAYYAKSGGASVTWVRHRSRPRSFERDGKTGTMYLGVASKGSNAHMRLYDKKREQLERHGRYYGRAEAVNSWIRLEVVLTNKYAHQATDVLQDVEDADELKHCLADMILQRYSFFRLRAGKRSTPLPPTALLLDPERLRLPLSSVEPMRELEDAYLYLRDGSGLYSLLLRVQMVWGTEAFEAVWGQLRAEYTFYKPSRSVRAMNDKKTAEYRKRYPTVSDFIERVRWRNE